MIELHDYDDVFTHMMPDIKRLAQISCRGRYDLVDELIGEALDRIVGICETWDPNLASLRTHVKVNVRRYMWKWMNKRMRRDIANRVPMDDGMRAALSHEHDSDLREQVEYFLSALTDTERRVVELKLMQDKTYGDVAYELHMSGPEVRRVLNAAMVKMLKARHELRRRLPSTSGA